MKCKNCGQELANGVKFCTNCGCPVDNINLHDSKSKPTEGDVILVTTPNVPNHRIVSFYGAAIASWVEIAAKRSGLFEAIDALSGNLGGDSYLSTIEEKCYINASNRLMDVARSINCNAIIGLRYNSVYSEEVIHVTAYGTACVIEKQI